MGAVRNDAAMGAGIVLTSLGVAGTVGSSAMWIYGIYEEDDALGPAAAMSLVYFLVILLLCWVFYTVMTREEASEQER